MERLTDEELARLSTPGPIAKIEYPDGNADVLHIVTVWHSDLASLLTELRTRRAADLNDDALDALKMVAIMLHEDDDVRLRYGWQQRYRVAQETLARLLEGRRVA